MGYFTNFQNYADISVSEILGQFVYDKEHGIKRYRWRVIPAKQYYNALKQYACSWDGEFRFPERILRDWLDLCCENSIIFSIFHDFYYLDGRTFQAAPYNKDIEKEISLFFTGDYYSMDWQEGIAKLKDMKFFNYARIPDGSLAYSDMIGIKEYRKVIDELDLEPTKEEMIVTINRCIDITHQRGDLASIILEGGSKNARKISMGIYEHKLYGKPSDMDVILASSNLNNNFWKWFGNSEVVDDNGNPLIVYHGTNETFDIFKSNKSGGSKISAIYFTDDKDIAQMYNDCGVCKSYYLKIENPFYYDCKGNTFVHNSYKFYDDLMQSAIDNGHDGVILQNIIDDPYQEYDYFDKPNSANTYIVFNPNQIKSVNNNGNWSLTNNSVLAYKINTNWPSAEEIWNYLCEVSDEDEYVNYNYPEVLEKINKIKNIFDKEYKKDNNHILCSRIIGLNILINNEKELIEFIKDNENSIGNYWALGYNSPEIYQNGDRDYIYCFNGCINNKYIDWLEIIPFNMMNIWEIEDFENLDVTNANELIFSDEDFEIEIYEVIVYDGNTQEEINKIELPKPIKLYANNDGISTCE